MGPRVFWCRTVSHPKGWSSLPDYEIRGQFLYRTISHPLGWTGFPDYRISGVRVFRTVSHPDGWSGLSDFTIVRGKVYRTVSHPDGWSGLPEYEMVHQGTPPARAVKAKKRKRAAVSVNSYLTDEASKLVLSGDELKGIRTSIGTLQSRLKDHFGSTITSHFQFGSSTRDTILPRKADELSDIDYMVVFDTKDGEKKPQTYLDRLKAFAEKKYSTSEVKQSNPVVILELNHIRFELVPAVYLYGYKIPSPAASFSEWMYTDPDAHTKKVDEKNKSTNYFAKRVIRLVKRWNASNSYPFRSFDLEQRAVDTYYWSTSSSLKDYFYTFWESVGYTYDTAQWAKDKMDAAKKHAANAKQYEKDDKPYSAEAEIKKIVPAL